MRNYYTKHLNKQSFTIFTPDPLRAKVEAYSGGKNTVIYDVNGNPSIMVRVDPVDLGLLSGNYGTGTHPAFESGYEYWVGKYLASNPGDGLAVSLPNADPWAVINFDNALTACRNKGAGWDLLPNELWATIAIKAHNDGVMPHGNNRYGKDYSFSTEHGIRQDWGVTGLTSGTARTLTGSGPNTWSHDGTDLGIYNLNGNVWEWVSGMRLQDGEIQVITSPWGKENSSTSVEWKAILQDGSLVAPGTVGTLKYDATNVDGSGSVRVNTTVVNQSDGTTYASEQLELVVASSGVTIPDLLRQLALAPGATGLQYDRLYMRNLSERVLFRGGTWGSATYAGGFAGNLNSPRATASTGVGFRPAYRSQV